MPHFYETATRLADVPGVSVQENVPLSEYTRFGLGGPASLLADVNSEKALAAVVSDLRQRREQWIVIGGGTNLVVSDEGFDGIVVRYTDARISESKSGVRAGAGAVLQTLVDYTIASGLAGIHTMTGVPGWVGGAVYGNAGAYGRSMHENVISVSFFDGQQIRFFDNAACDFRYRHSNFKTNKDWIILATDLQLTPADRDELKAVASNILAIRNAKYPPEMKCAGSIFKNLLLADLPPNVQSGVDPKAIREGKVPSAWFLEQVGAKGLRKGGIEVADYHANLIYNTGTGKAAEVRELIAELKARVAAQFGFTVEEEVQYVGF